MRWTGRNWGDRPLAIMLSTRAEHEVQVWQSACRDMDASIASGRTLGTVRKQVRDKRLAPRFDRRRRPGVCATRLEAVAAHGRALDVHAKAAKARAGDGRVPGVTELLQLSRQIKGQPRRVEWEKPSGESDGPETRAKARLRAQAGAAAARAIPAIQASVLRGDKLSGGAPLDMEQVLRLAENMRLGLPLPKDALPASERELKAHEKALGAVERSNRHALERIEQLKVSMEALVVASHACDRHTDPTVAAGGGGQREREGGRDPLELSRSLT